MFHAAKEMLRDRVSEEVYKMILGYWRCRQKKWLRNLAAEI